MTRLLLWLSALAPASLALSSSSPPDLYAYPKYRVDLTRDLVSNATASSIISEAQAGYELLRTASGQAFLCKIPVAEPRQEQEAGQTQDGGQKKVEQALTPQERRSQRQVNLQAGLERGLALLESLKGACLYQRAGWFTYAFCYGKNVRQFHEIRRQRGPQEDPNTHSYVLGQYPAAPDTQQQQQHHIVPQIQPGAVEVVQANTQVGLGASGLSDVLSAESDIELEEDSDSGKRYLVQHWTGGTSCDMTGLERKVEVQFHCNTQSNDRIALIRETAICQYVLVIHTPRLCGEPLFLAAGTSANKPVGSINCQPIVTDPQQHAIDARQRAEESPASQEAAPESTSPAAAAQKLPEDFSNAHVELKHEDDVDVVIIFDDETGQVLTSSSQEHFQDASQGESDDAASYQDLAKAVQRSLQALNVEDDEGVDGQSDEERLASVVKALFGGSQRQRQEQPAPVNLTPKTESQQHDSPFVGSNRHRDLRQRYFESFKGKQEEASSQEKDQSKEQPRVRDEL